MRFTVIGAGNTGQIMAFDLVSKGADVRVYTRNADKAARLSQHGITAEGRLAGRVSLSLATTDMGEAVRGADAVFVMTTAEGRRPVAEAVRPFLEPGQIVIVFNGNWGAFEFDQVLNAGSRRTEAVIAETGTQLYIGSAVEPGRVFCKQVKQRVTLAATQPELCNGVIRRLRDFFPQFVPAANVVETSLSSANAAIHVPVCLFNIARIELGEDFFFYTQGASRSTVAYIERMDKERMAVMTALGLEARPMLEILNSFWPDKKSTLYDAIRENVSYQAVKGPKSLKHRFFTEDIPYGIAPQAHLGKRLGLPMPHMNALLESLERFMGRELVASGPRPAPEDLFRLMA